MSKLARWWWLVIPAGLTVWIVYGFVGNVRSILGVYVGKPFDIFFYRAMDSILRETLVWLYAVLASTIIPIVFSRRTTSTQG